MPVTLRGMRPPVLLLDFDALRKLATASAEVPVVATLAGVAAALGYA